jgi:hypothetical protein
MKGRREKKDGNVVIKGEKTKCLEGIEFKGVKHGKEGEIKSKRLGEEYR